MLQRLSALDRIEDLPEIIGMVRRYQRRDRAADHVLRGISVHTFSPPVPDRNDAVRCSTHNGIVRNSLSAQTIDELLHLRKVFFPERDRRVFEESTISLPALKERLLCLDPFPDLVCESLIRPRQFRRPFANALF